MLDRYLGQNGDGGKRPRSVRAGRSKGKEKRDNCQKALRRIRVDKLPLCTRGAGFLWPRSLWERCELRMTRTIHLARHAGSQGQCLDLWSWMLWGYVRPLIRGQNGNN